jgi:succinyl-CoA synthetase beta subunit
MWLSPEQACAIVEACGLLPAPAGARSTHCLEIRLDPVAAAIRLEMWAGAAAGGEPAATVIATERLWECEARALLVSAGLAAWLPSSEPVVRLFEAFCRYELLSLQVDLTGGASGARFSGARALCDGNAAFRNAQVAGLLAATQPEATTRLKKLGIDYVQLDGRVGLLSVGAGETMAAMDLLAAAGSPAACFLDVSGGFGVDALTAALRQLASLPDVRAVLVNIFGGVTRVDRVAESILSALDEVSGLEAPVVIRLEGTEAERGRALLAAKGFRSEPTLRGAVSAAVAASRGSPA